MNSYDTAQGSTPGRSESAVSVPIDQNEMFRHQHCHLPLADRADLVLVAPPLAALSDLADAELLEHSRFRIF